jgi:NADPH:quinone reductase-like Zn-dependent oxidoreductase
MSKCRRWIYRKNPISYDLAQAPQEAPTQANLKPDECLIGVRAVSLNYRDRIQWRNLAGRNVDGKVPASDGAGEILAVGEAVTGFQVGDRVAVNFFPTWKSGRFDLAYHQADLGGNHDGMLRDYAIFSQDSLAKIPSGWSFVQAATLPCAALTAWVALYHRGNLKASQSVCVLGTGGVSIFALQFAKLMGARVAITSSCDHKLQRAMSLGADFGVNYRSSPEWSKSIWTWTEGKGVDHVVEVGGPGTLDQSMKSVSADGHIALIGVLTGFGPPATSLFPLLARNVRLDGIYVGSCEHFRSMVRFIEANPFSPQIDRVFTFDQTPEAFAYLESGEHFGKIVIEL